MTKATPRHPKQLEMPLLTNLNNRNYKAQSSVTLQNTTVNKHGPEQTDILLKATSDDLKIYQSISEGFLRRYR